MESRRGLMAKDAALLLSITWGPTDYDTRDDLIR